MGCWVLWGRRCRISLGWRCRWAPSWTGAHNGNGAGLQPGLLGLLLAAEQIPSYPPAHPHCTALLATHPIPNCVRAAWVGAGAGLEHRRQVFAPPHYSVGAGRQACAGVRCVGRHAAAEGRSPAGCWEPARHRTLCCCMSWSPAQVLPHPPTPPAPHSIPGAAFASNAHAGAFVLALCARAKERRGEDARCAALVVCKV